ncbi:hypothetical protein [Candidatus Nitrotoga sp. 1052]|uniref:hypothetical protein n=1 Tax=Candidatus Nitrotoga sp. 1052 TaxID=2886964 RepID=UPI001EF6776C|nr:hypothetical protein [Candidatus Nitrotoga sp. 1052]
MAQRNRSLNLRPTKSRTALTITHPNTAGIEIGSASYFVAVCQRGDKYRLIFARLFQPPVCWVVVPHLGSEAAIVNQ